MTTDTVADVFELHRDRLFGVAYRMTGSVADAHDLCQDAWVRWQAVNPATVDNAEAFLVRIITRLAIDLSRSAHARREGYPGAYLPEPVVRDAFVGSPEDNAVVADSMTFAFLVVLDELAPIERAVFLLHDVFGYAFTEIGQAVDRSPAACRQIASRSRRRIQEHPTGCPRVSTVQEAELLTEAVSRVMAGDITGLMTLLAPDVVQLDDGGPRQHAARYPIVGPERVARFLVNIAKRIVPGTTVETVTVNERVGLLFRVDDTAGLVMCFDLNPDGKVWRIFAQLNPDKLRHLNP